MAVKLEFINILIPVRNIERCASIGGFKGYLERRVGLLGEIEWHDEHLFRTGVMNPMEIGDVVDEWEEYGLTPVIEEGGTRKWGDICVVDSAGGPTLPCDWIEFDLAERCAWLKGTAKGTVVGRASGWVAP